MRISGAGNVCQRAKQIKDAAQRTMNSSKPVIPRVCGRLHEQNKQPSSNTPGQSAGCRSSSLTLARHIFTVWPQMTQQGPALCVPGRTAVLIYCKSRLFQPANPNTALVNGTRWTAGVVLRLFASTSTEALLKSHLERAEASRRHLKQTWRKRLWTGGSTGAALCVFERVGLSVNCELRFPWRCSAFQQCHCVICVCYVLTCNLFLWFIPKLNFQYQSSVSHWALF